MEFKSTPEAIRVIIEYKEFMRKGIIRFTDNNPSVTKVTYTSEKGDATDTVNITIQSNIPSTDTDYTDGNCCLYLSIDIVPIHRDNEYDGCVRCEFEFGYMDDSNKEDWDKLDGMGYTHQDDLTIIQWLIEKYIPKI